MGQSFVETGLGIQQQCFLAKSPLDQSLVSFVVPDPKPSYRITLKYSQGTISKGYSKRPNMFLVIDTLET
jgi:hypothetical protein